jgi:excisionase family DNA binding protein
VTKLAYSTAEVCKMMPISISRLLDLIHRNEIVAVKVGRSWCIPAAPLSAYLDRIVAERDTAVGR